MKIFFILFTLLTFLNASEVIKQNIYEKDNQVDIMLSFDSPYKGKISQKLDNTDIILMLKDATIKKEVLKNIDSQLIQSMQILPYANGLLVKLSSDKSFDVTASKTVDNYGLRLRITPKISPLDESLVVITDEKKYQTKKDEDGIGYAYLKVILLLFAIVLFLYFLKNWVQTKKGELGTSWLFDKNQETSKSKSIKILQQKGLDHKNRVSLISFEDRRYLVILGENNILLDKFDDAHDITNDTTFDNHLKENEQALNDFIAQESYKFDSYKQKASNSKI